MRKKLSRKEMELLVVLDKYPLANYSEIGKILNLTHTTIAKYYIELSQKVKLSVVARLNLDYLDMEVVSIIVEINSSKNCEVIEEFCDHHSYPKYRSRIYGKINGMFIQFCIPKGTKNTIENQIKDLQSKKIILSYKIFYKKFSNILTKMDLKSWNNIDEWNFDWNLWGDNLRQRIQSDNRNNYEIMTDNNSKLDKFDLLDIYILEQLTLGSIRRKNVDIIEAIEKKLPKKNRFSPLTKQTFSRRLKILNKSLVLDNHLFFDWNSIDNFTIVGFFCQTKKKTLAAFFNHLSKNPIPFTSNFQIISENHFFWYVQLPSPHYLYLSRIVWDLAIEMELYLFDFKSVMNYGLWPEMYEEKNHSWNISY